MYRNSATLVLLALLTPRMCPAQNLVVNGDFENDFDGWTVVEQATIETATVHSGGKAFKSHDPDSAAYAYIWREFPLEYSQNEITYWVYPASAFYRSTFELIREWRAGTAIFNTRVSVLDDRVAFTAVDTSAVLFEPLPLGQWSKITIQVDSTSRRQDFFVNDQLAASLVSDSLPAVEHLLVGDLSISGMWGTVYYDDISVTGGALSNRPPRVKDDSLELDVPVSGVLSGSINVLDNDGDPDGDSLIVTSFDQPSSGNLVWADDGSVTFELTGWDAAEPLTLDLEYTVSDGALSATGILTIRYAGDLVAMDDHFVADGPDPRFFPLLRNDRIPEGADIQISITRPPQFGEILSIEADGVWYQKLDVNRQGMDEFSYALTVQDASGKITTSHEGDANSDNGCYCLWISCFFDKPASGFVAKTIAAAVGADSLDLDLLHRARDVALGATEVGSALLEDFIFNSPEILQLILNSRSELTGLTINMLDVMQDPARSLLDGDGSETITQAQMDTVSAFFEQVSAGVSEELREILQTHVARLGPFDQYVGMTVQEAFEAVGGLSTDVQDDRPEIPEDLVLEPNFPNPFAGSTEIRFKLPDPAVVTLAIYDIQGRKVRTLVSGEQRSGLQSIRWDRLSDGGTGVPPGTYFVRLAGPDLSRARKIVVGR